MCIWFLLGWTTLTAAAQETSYPQPKNFNITESSVTDLLSQKSISELFQDSSGFLWIRTQDGVHRYDGYDIRSFYPNEDGLGSLGHGGGSHITEDQSGTIWLATLGRGLAFYDPYIGHFTLAHERSTENSTFYSSDISTIYTGQGGSIWLGYFDGSVQRFNPLSKTIDLNLDLEAGLGTIVGFAEDQQRSIWLATSPGVLLKCNAPHWGCRRFNYLKNYQGDISSVRIYTIAKGQGNLLWIGTEASGAFLVNTDDQSVTHFYSDPNNSKSLSDNSIRRIYTDHKKRTWLGTNRGLSMYRGGTGFTRFDSSNSGLVYDTVMSMVQGHRGNFWFGSYYGLYMGLESNIETFNQIRGLPVTGITAFTEQDDAYIWIGTYKGLFRFDKASEQISRAQDAILNIRLRDERVMSLEYDAPYLWIGYRAHGLDKIDVSNARSPIPNTDLEPRLSKAAVSEIVSMPHDIQIISTFGQGLHFLSKNAELSMRSSGESNDRNSLSSDKIFTTGKLQDGSYLAGTIRGLNHFRLESQESAHIPVPSSVAKYLPNTQILTIAEDRNNNIWLGSQNAGLILWRHADRLAGKSIFTKVKTTPPMPSSTLYAIEMDDSGKLWISTTNGLVRLNPDTLEIVTFDRSDGLQDNEFNFGASLKDSDGKLYFGGNRGFNRFSPEDVVLNATLPPMRMTDIDIAGETLAMDVSYVDIHTLGLSHKHYFVNFEFSVLDFTNPANNRYKYKLDNFDADWVDIGTRHNVSFTNLPPGKFVLQVSGATSDGIWNNNGIRMPINVYPPPWFRWWAFTFYGSFLVCLAVLIRKFYDTYRQKEQATEFATEMHNTAELAMDDLEDQLEMEQVLVRNLHNHAESTLKLVADFLERQAESIDDDVILDAFEDSQQRLACLQLLENNMIYTAQFLEIDFQKFLEDLFAQIFPLDTPPELEVVPVNDAPEQILEVAIAVPAALIANELVMNSARHAFAGATGIQTVRVHMQEKRERNGWILEVSDSGSGLPTEVDPGNPTTTGLEIVARFSRELNAVVTVDRNKGARFRFEIPRLKPDHSDS